MAISEDEAIQIIAAIEEAIPDGIADGGRGSLSEFLQQWRAEIEAGRPVDRRLKVQESPGLDELAGVPRSRTSTTGEFVGKADYRQVERLDLLLEALGLSLVAPQMMASRFISTIERYRGDGDSAKPVLVSLAQTGEAGDPRLQLDRGTVDQAMQDVSPLARLLEELSHDTGLRERPVAAAQDMA